MFRLIALLLCLLLSRPGWAATSLDHAAYARNLLGPDIWSRLIEVENVSRTGPYPKTVYALVFELGGVLWFYTDTDGTQSFSLHVGDLAAEKSNFDPLLHDIDRGFVRYRVLADATYQASPSKLRELPNGCLIESYAALRERIDHGEAITQARLLTFYADVGTKRTGHTVLLYETPAGTFQIDPSLDGGPRRVSISSRNVSGLLAGDAYSLARALNPELAVVKARWVPTTMPRAAAGLANVDSERSGAFVRRGMATTMP